MGEATTSIIASRSRLANSSSDAAVDRDGDAIELDLSSSGVSGASDVRSIDDVLTRPPTGICPKSDS